MDYSFTLLRGSAARVATTVISIAITFFLFPFLVRSLGDHLYGLWVVISGIALYYYLLDLGLSGAVNRFVTAEIARRDNAKVNQIVSTSAVVFGILGFIVLICSAGVWLLVPRFVSPQDVSAVRAVVIIQGVNMGLGFPFKAFGGVTIAQLRYDLIEIGNLLRIAADAGLTVYVLTHGGGIVGLACVGFGVGQAYNLMYYFLAKRLWPALSVSVFQARWRIARDLFAYGAWAFINQVSDMVRFRVDSLVVGGFCGASVVTHYSVGASLAEYGLILINRATNILAPVFVRYDAEGDRDAIRSKLLFFTKVNAALSVYGFGLLFVVGQLFIERWMGSRYSDAYPVLLIMGVALMVEATMLPANNVLYGLARHRPYAIAAVCEAAANALFSIVLVQWFGMLGVAIGTAVPLLVNKFLFTPLYTCRVVGLSPWQLYRPLVRTAVVTGALLVGVREAILYYDVQPAYPSIVIVLLVASAAYLPLALYGVLDGVERSFVWRVVRRCGARPGDAGAAARIRDGAIRNGR